MNDLGMLGRRRFSNHVSTIAARAQNLDVVIIAEAGRACPVKWRCQTRQSSGPTTWQVARSA